MAENNGFNRRTSPSSPPAKIARVEFLAPRSPPDMERVNCPQPLAVAPAAISDVHSKSSFTLKKIFEI
ncbi:unnamed protein product [Citrullus colocynthis]|uniref:Uncharacterized protein n=1 Tax=Citrullus colocynthis TaxID=252529 RepID=A0ABP0Z1M2_9ROSI